MLVYDCFHDQFQQIVLMISASRRVIFTPALIVIRFVAALNLASLATLNLAPNNKTLAIRFGTGM